MLATANRALEQTSPRGDGGGIELLWPLPTDDDREEKNSGERVKDFLSGPQRLSAATKRCC